jgi:DNA replication regulator DPB11
MGGKHVLDLTSDVTHLICGELYTPKYKYVAKMRSDVKVMQPEWVDAMYSIWLKGDDINPKDFEARHRFPTFAGLRISVTGIPDGKHLVRDLCPVVWFVD